MNSFTKFFHELISPHCLHCMKQRQEELEQREMDREINSICQSCESLKMQLAIVNQQNTLLLNKLIESKVESIPERNSDDLKPIQTRQVPWNVKRQQLEQESRELAASLKNAVQPDKEFKKLEIDKLEQSIGLDNGTSKTINS